MTTLNTMVKRVAGLQDTVHVNAWENSFITRILELTKNGDDTRPLTEPQVVALERLFKKHFGD